jgi:hypothetical protein
LGEIDGHRLAPGESDQVSGQSTLPAVHDIVKGQIVSLAQPRHRENVRIFLRPSHEPIMAPGKKDGIQFARDEPKDY